MKILHLVGRSHQRGAELVALELAEELTLLGHDNVLRAVGLGHEGTADDRLPPLVGAVGQGPRRLVRAGLRLRRDLHAEPVDVVLAHGGAAVQVACLARSRGGPVVVWQRILAFPDALGGRLRGWWWRAVLRRVGGAFALTDDLASELEVLGFTGPVWVVPNFRRPERLVGLDPVRCGSALRRELGLAASVSLIGLVGHLVPQKQPLAAARVLAAVRKRGVDAHLVVAGSGPLAADLQEELGRCSVAAHATLVGHRRDVGELLAGLDLLVLTSETEGIPGVVIEAAMAGCPVVSYPVGGVAEVVVDGVTGTVVGVADPVVLAEAVVELLEAPRRRATMGGAARDGSHRFAASTVVGAYDRHLRALVSG